MSITAEDQSKRRTEENELKKLLNSKTSLSKLMKEENDERLSISDLTKIINCKYSKKWNANMATRYELRCRQLNQTKFQAR